GVMTGKFTRHLKGKGRVFGIKFRPGAFYPVLRANLSTLTDRSKPLREVFGAAGVRYGRNLREEESAHGCVEIAENFLRAQQLQWDPRIEEICHWVEQTAKDRSITRVEHLVERSGLSLRTLQRLFGIYVGVSPKWIVQRYRLHEAAEQLA